VAKGTARALLIDPKEREIKAIQLKVSPEALQAMVGGDIELEVSPRSGASWASWV
jgi:hypothetical protein